MSKRVAILQSSYIPWRGYFDIINMVDEFILFDDVQFTKRDWRNRNKIKTEKGTRWLTIPVETKSKYEQLICDTVIANNTWPVTHWSTIKHNYSKAAYFHAYKDNFEDLFGQCRDLKRLSDINYLFLSEICKTLGITTQITWSMDYEASGSKTDRLVSICTASGADVYLSGPAAKAYIEPDCFSSKGIVIEYMDYSNYPSYTQQFGEFDHYLSIIDLIFNEDSDAPRYMKSFS